MIPINVITDTNGIHNGDVTHHQLQSILSVNFNTRKIRNNNVPNLIPFEVFFSAILLCKYGC